MKLILHNSVSLDGSYLNFEVDMGLHYQIIGAYHPDIYLVGSLTAKKGIDMYHKSIPDEGPEDYQKPDRLKTLSYWVIPDTKGVLQNMLHVYRRFEFCRDVILLVSGTTPSCYLEYLARRNYDYIFAGKEQIDYREAFISLQNNFHASTILADTGKTLGNILLNDHLVNEISLLIHPTVSGYQSENLFSGVEVPISLKLIKNETFNNAYIWLSYIVNYQ